MIEVKQDHKLNFPPIKVPRYNEDNDEGEQIFNQTEIEGVLVPLLRFNNTVITFEQVDKMILTCNPIPRIDITITDFLQIVRIFDQPGHDNILYLQILPPFDDAYKKIQLAFRIEYSQIKGNRFRMSGVYMVPGIFDTQMKPYGITTTYELFEQVANDLSLGFCSNVDETNDERYIYNPNLRLPELLSSEVQFAGEKGHVFTWWIDFWNNINLVDIYKEYNEVLPDDQLQIWLSDNFKDSLNKAEPYPQIAAFTNSPAFAASPMFVPTYKPILETNNTTDMNFETYSMENQEASSTIIQDGDFQHEVNKGVGYVYGGEIFGKFDYLSQRACRGMFLNKVNETKIELVAHYPLLGLMKGGHVNFWWYDINNMVTDEVDNSNIESNSPIPDDSVDELNTPDGRISINRTVSGQYYIDDIVYKYTGHRNWEVKYTLCRSAEYVQRLAPPSEETFLK